MTLQMNYQEKYEQGIEQGVEQEKIDSAMRMIEANISDRLHRLIQLSRKVIFRLFTINKVKQFFHFWCDIIHCTLSIQNNLRGGNRK